MAVAGDAVRATEPQALSFYQGMAPVSGVASSHCETFDISATGWVIMCEGLDAGGSRVVPDTFWRTSPSNGMWTSTLMLDGSTYYSMAKGQSVVVP